MRLSALAIFMTAMDVDDDGALSGIADRPGIRVFKVRGNHDALSRAF